MHAGPPSNLEPISENGPDCRSDRDFPGLRSEPQMHTREPGGGRTPSLLPSLILLLATTSLLSVRSETSLPSPDKYTPLPTLSRRCWSIKGMSTCSFLNGHTFYDAETPDGQFGGIPCTVNMHSFAPLLRPFLRPHMLRMTNLHATTCVRTPHTALALTQLPPLSHRSPPLHSTRPSNQQDDAFRNPPSAGRRGGSAGPMEHRVEPHLGGGRPVDGHRLARRQPERPP